MLKQAETNLAGISLKVDLACVDYCHLEDYCKVEFDAIACLSSAVDEMTTHFDVLKAFKSMYSVLKPGGILILTQGTSDHQWNSKPRFIPAVNTPEFTRLFVIDYLEKGADYNIVDIYHSSDRREIKTWTMHFNQILLHDDMEKLLLTAGFNQNRFFGDYSFSPYRKESGNRLIVIAVK